MTSPWCLPLQVVCVTLATDVVVLEGPAQDDDPDNQTNDASDLEDNISADDGTNESNEDGCCHYDRGEPLEETN